MLGQASNKAFFRAILDKVFTDPSGVVQQQLRRLQEEAIDRGEFTALTHDGSYKLCFPSLVRPR